jgi:hypothetical protein
MKKLYVYRTSVGSFYIGQSDDGHFHPIFDNEILGSYAHAWQAAEDLAGGHTSGLDISSKGRVDTAKLGIPEDLSEWERIG